MSKVTYRRLTEQQLRKALFIDGDTVNISAVRRYLNRLYTYSGPIDNDVKLALMEECKVRQTGDIIVPIQLPKRVVEQGEPSVQVVELDDTNLLYYPRLVSSGLKDLAVKSATGLQIPWEVPADEVVEAMESGSFTLYNFWAWLGDELIYTINEVLPTRMTQSWAAAAISERLSKFYAASLEPIRNGIHVKAHEVVAMAAVYGSTKSHQIPWVPNVSNPDTFEKVLAVFHKVVLEEGGDILFTQKSAAGFKFAIRTPVFITKLVPWYGLTAKERVPREMFTAVANAQEFVNDAFAAEIDGEKSRYVKDLPCAILDYPHYVQAYGKNVDAVVGTAWLRYGHVLDVVKEEVLHVSPDDAACVEDVQNFVKNIFGEDAEVNAKMIEKRTSLTAINPSSGEPEALYDRVWHVNVRRKVGANVTFKVVTIGAVKGMVIVCDDLFVEKRLGEDFYRPIYLIFSRSSVIKKNAGPLVVKMAVSRLPKEVQSTLINSNPADGAELVRRTVRSLNEAWDMSTDGTEGVSEIYILRQPRNVENTFLAPHVHVLGYTWDEEQGTMVPVDGVGEIPGRVVPVKAKGSNEVVRTLVGNIPVIRTQHDSVFLSPLRMKGVTKGLQIDPFMAIGRKYAYMTVDRTQKSLMDFAQDFYRFIADGSEQVLTGSFAEGVKLVKVTETLKREGMPHQVSVDDDLTGTVLHELQHEGERPYLEIAGKKLVLPPISLFKIRPTKYYFADGSSKEIVLLHDLLRTADAMVGDMRSRYGISEGTKQVRKEQLAQYMSVALEKHVSKTENEEPGLIAYALPYKNLGEREFGINVRLAKRLVKHCPQEILEILYKRIPEVVRIEKELVFELESLRERVKNEPAGSELVYQLALSLDEMPVFGFRYPAGSSTSYELKSLRVLVGAPHDAIYTNQHAISVRHQGDDDGDQLELHLLRAGDLEQMMSSGDLPPVRQNEGLPWRWQLTWGAVGFSVHEAAFAEQRPAEEIMAGFRVRERYIGVIYNRFHSFMYAASRFWKELRDWEVATYGRSEIGSPEDVILRLLDAYIVVIEGVMDARKDEETSKGAKELLSEILTAFEDKGPKALSENLRNLPVREDPEDDKKFRPQDPEFMAKALELIKEAGTEDLLLVSGSKFSAADAESWNLGLALNNKKFESNYLHFLMRKLKRSLAEEVLKGLLLDPTALRKGWSEE